MLSYALALYLLMHSVSSLPAVTQVFGDHGSNTLPSPAVCGSDTPRRKHMAGSKSPQLRKLSEYERVCKAAFADQHMLFSAMPTTDAEATQVGNAMATTLKEFDAYSIRPLVILEPVRPDGVILSLAEAAKGAYNDPMRRYYQTLQSRGITDAMMGTWVPFPEANTPVWTLTDAPDFVAAVTAIVQLQKQAFPDSQASILLGSQSYPSNDTTWTQGAFRSLKPYTAGIPMGLIDSFGYQGFPWLPPANQQGYPLTDAKRFLRTDFAAEAAASLGVRNIWFNTGTFSRAHTTDPATLVALSADQRRSMLSGIVRQAGALQKQGYEVAINIFAEDKSTTTEAIDWSYWPAGKTKDSQSAAVFRSFVAQAHARDIPVWVFDDDHQGVRLVSGSRSQHH